jgi:hypothetical protein
MANAQAKSRRLKNTRTRSPPTLAPTEPRGLGTEGWLGVMVFFGIVLGVLYARLALP